MKQKLYSVLCLATLVVPVLYANENNATLNSYLSDLKKRSFGYDYEKNEAQSSMLRDSWIAPIQVNYSYKKSKPYTQEQVNEAAAIRIDQPIFQSGGIYYGVKFANASKLYGDYSIDVAKRKMIKQSVALLMQIKQMTYKIQKQHYLIKNAQINLEQKKEQYMSGQLDSGFLDNAIIQTNILQQTLYDFQTAKERLVTQFEALSDLDYKTAHIPHLDFLSAKEFLEQKHNIVLKQSSAQIQQNKYATNVRIAKYLPKVSLVAGYNWSKSSGQKMFVGGQLIDSSNELHYYDYGVRVALPFDINTFRDVESAKVDYFKAQVQQQDTQRQLKALYRQVMQNIENYDKKIVLAQQNQKLYEKLFHDTQELFYGGYKTQYDVDNMKNSLEIQKLDISIFELDKQLELLNLYEMYINGGK